MIYRPVRERKPKAIIDAMVRSVAEAGYDEASLTSLSTADYSAIAPLVHESIEALAPYQVSLSVSSLRAYGLSENVLDDMKRQRAGGLTFAPEAGSQRMRDVVNKNVTDEQLMETAERVFSRGWNKMKLYFMIGLPTEEDEDVRDIVRTGARALDVARRVQRNKRARVTVSVSTHVPKPHTPFQWCAMDSHEEILRKQSMLRYEAASTRVQLKMHKSDGSWLEGMLARGDRRLADVIQGAYREVLASIPGTRSSTSRHGRHLSTTPASIPTGFSGRFRSRHSWPGRTSTSGSSRGSSRESTAKPFATD